MIAPADLRRQLFPCPTLSRSGGPDRTRCGRPTNAPRQPAPGPSEPGFAPIPSSDGPGAGWRGARKSTRLNPSHVAIAYADLRVGEKTPPAAVAAAAPPGPALR